MPTLDLQPLAGARFGRHVRVRDAHASADAIETLEAEAEALTGAFYEGHGFLLLTGLDVISSDPSQLVRLSRLFGPEVEDYTKTGSALTRVHPQVPEILVISNKAPMNQAPPARPTPPLTADGALPVQFPQRRGWHTDQSFRRPPPDISLFYCVEPAPIDQAQTLYADGISAYEGLSDAMKARIAGIEALHVQPGTGRSEVAVRAGETPQPLGPLQQPQRQPLVRVHPVTGQKALYLCESGQLDWIEGPIIGMEKGPDGAGAALVYELMSHFTSPPFTYVQEWRAGDLVVYDNRCTIHSATWFDGDSHERVMWRTTVRGNPGPEYADEPPSWLPAA